MFDKILQDWTSNSVGIAGHKRIYTQGISLLPLDKAANFARTAVTTAEMIILCLNPTELF